MASAENTYQALNGLRVAMIVRSTLFSVPGGDTVQVTETARRLSLHDIHVDIRLAGERIDYASYGLLHFFNLIRPADVLRHIQNCGVPFVVSPVYVDYSEYDRIYRKGLAGRLLSLLDADGIEYVKTLARWLKGKDRLVSKQYLWIGHRKSVQKIISGASLLLPNSWSEMRRIHTHYREPCRAVVVPNGVDKDFFRMDAGMAREENLVICVARIEGIKNQLNLIRALNGTAYRLVLIGDYAPNQRGYYKQCRRLAAANVSFTGRLPREELLAYYHRASVHVLPSWFETTGLSSLEAATTGCNIVVSSRGDVREYLGEDAWYCDPASPDSILDAVTKASAAVADPGLRDKLLSRFTWHQATLSTLGAYQQVLSL